MVRNWSFLIKKQNRKYNRFIIDNIKIDEVDWTSLTIRRLLHNLHLIRIKKWKRFYFKNYLLTAGIGCFFAKYRNFFIRRWEFTVFAILSKYSLFYNSFLFSLNSLILDKFLFLKILQKNNVLFFFKYINGTNIFALLNFSLNNSLIFKQNKTFFVQFLTQKHFPADFIFLSKYTLFFSFKTNLNYKTLFNLFYLAFKMAPTVPKLVLSLFKYNTDRGLELTPPLFNFKLFQFLQWSYKILIFNFLITLYIKLQTIYLNSLFFN